MKILKTLIIISFKKQQQQKISIVAPNRHLIREDIVITIHGGDITKNRRLFLFNDMIIIAKKDWKDKYHLVQKSSLRDARVFNVEDDTTGECSLLYIYIYISFLYFLPNLAEMVFNSPCYL